MLVDTHCHLDFQDYATDCSEVLRRAQQVGVRQIITIGIDIPSSLRAIALAETNGGVYATVGIHPHNACPLTSEEVQALLSLGRKSQVVAYGEIGLDFYRDYQPRSLQISCLHEQLDLARELNLPVIIHDREAHQDILQALRDQSAWEMAGTLHCYSGDWSFARRCLDLGFYLSIAGPVTFKTAKDLQDVTRNCPLNRLLLETDAPFLAPVPNRGKRNEPAFLVHTAKKVAALKNLSLEDVAHQTTLNARQLFKLPELGDSTEPEHNG